MQSERGQFAAVVQWINNAIVSILSFWSWVSCLDKLLLVQHTLVVLLLQTRMRLCEQLIAETYMITDNHYSQSLNSLSNPDQPTNNNATQHNSNLKLKLNHSNHVYTTRHLCQTCFHAILRLATTTILESYPQNPSTNPQRTHTKSWSGKITSTKPNSSANFRITRYIWLDDNTRLDRSVRLGDTWLLSSWPPRAYRNRDGLISRRSRHRAQRRCQL